jgi:hypothetical protein
MADETNSNGRQDRFDRTLGSLVGIPDVLHTPPTTVRSTSPLVGAAQTSRKSSPASGTR